MNKKWKVILISLLMLPMLVFFPGCSCDEDSSSNSNRKPNTYTVTFYTNSSETFNVPSQTVEEGNLVREPDIPVKTGYDFLGWYRDTEETGWKLLWSFTTDTVTGNLKLYARWELRESKKN